MVSHTKVLNRQKTLLEHGKFLLSLACHSAVCKVKTMQNISERWVVIMKKLYCYALMSCTKIRQGKSDGFPQRPSEDDVNGSCNREVTVGVCRRLSR